MLACRAVRCTLGAPTSANFGDVRTVIFERCADTCDLLQNVGAPPFEMQICQLVSFESTVMPTCEIQNVNGQSSRFLCRQETLDVAVAFVAIMIVMAPCGHCTPCGRCSHCSPGGSHCYGGLHGIRGSSDVCGLPTLVAVLTLVAIVTLMTVVVLYGHYCSCGHCSPFVAS